MNQWRVSACTHTSAIWTLSTLITSPKGGKYLLEYLEKVVFFRAAVKQNYQTINAINRYTID